MEIKVGDKKIRVGSIVTRNMHGIINKLKVTEITDDLIICGGPGGWSFDKKTGWEVDEEMSQPPSYLEEYRIRIL